MTRRDFRAAALVMCLFAAAPLAAAPVETLESSAGRLSVEAMATGLAEPWAFGFLPDGTVLVTERGGRLLRIIAGRASEISGGPQVHVEGQGGLLDVMVPRDFAATREIWLSYAAQLPGGAATAIGRGRLSQNGERLEGFETIWAGDPARGGRHFGARLTEAPDGTIFLGTGDRGTGPTGQEAQSPSSSMGGVMAFSRDGRPRPAPKGWAPGLHSLGHRNIQGAAFDGQGALWVVEHGAKGGDEVNRVERGRNYGWPVIAYGVDYSGAKIGIGRAAKGMEQPKHYWDPSIAPSGLMVYQGEMFPGWKGSLFTGSLKFGRIHRLDPAQGFAEEILKGATTARLRDLRQGPDGAIWFLSVGQGALYRMAPQE